MLCFFFKKKKLNIGISYNTTRGCLFKRLRLRLTSNASATCLVPPKHSLLCMGDPHIFDKNTSLWKAALSCFLQAYGWCIQWKVLLFTVHLKWTVESETLPLSTERSQWSSTSLFTWTVVYDSDRTGSGRKLNALNQIRPSKKIIFYF